MRKRSDKLLRAAHVKSHTKGTSNELSFSVLDAAKNALEDGKPERPTEQARRFGRISLFTLPIGRKKPPSTPVKDQIQAITGSLANPVLPKARKLDSGAAEDAPAEAPAVMETSSAGEEPLSFGLTPSELSFESAPRRSGRTSRDEIAWRKTRRRRRRILAGVASSLIIVALLGAGVWWLYNDNERYQANIAQITSSHDLLAQTDAVLLELDEALQDPMGADAETFFAGRQEDVDKAVHACDQAERVAADASAGLRETVERTAADNLMATASARKTMFSSGWSVLEGAQSMKEPYEDLQDIWQEVLAADEHARRAAEQASSGDRQHIGASKDLSAQAQEQLTQATDRLYAFAQANPSVDVSPLVNYLDKRLEALGYAIASDTALEKRDTQAAIVNNDAYNEADEEAAGLAELLPADPGQPVLEAMEQAIANSVETYEAARAQASTSDAFLRDYFGSSAR